MLFEKCHSETVTLNFEGLMNPRLIVKSLMKPNDDYNQSSPFISLSLKGPMYNPSVTLDPQSHNFEYSKRHVALTIKATAKQTAFT